MVVAQLRGVQFGPVNHPCSEVDPTPHTQTDLFVLMGESNSTKAHQALEDIVDWLGFESINAYLETSAIEGKDILKRATYGKR